MNRNHVLLCVAVIALAAGTATFASQLDGAPQGPQSGGLDAKPKSKTAGVPSLKKDDSLAKPFKIAMEVSAGDEGAEVDVFFVGDAAIQLNNDDPPSVLVHYDLKDMSWRDPPKKQKVRLADGVAWAEASAKKSRQSLQKVADPKTKKFAALTLDPSFETKLDGETLVMTNEAFEYRISSDQKFAEGQKTRFFAYDHLNAYRKAMTDRKLPPFAQLVVTKELEKRAMIPSRLELTIRARERDFKLVSKLRIEEMSAEENRLVADALSRAKLGLAK